MEINVYTGRYGPDLPINVPVVASRELNATGLVPRTSYTFEVEAAHFSSIEVLRGPSAIVTGTTAVPTGM